jgi:transcription elongation factor/antiterminator RfaH
MIKEKTVTDDLEFTTDSGYGSRFHRAEGHQKWYVVYTKPSAEDVAKDHLEQKNIHVFLPKIREYRYSSKGKEAKVKPLFPNYLFAHMVYPDDYYAVIWAKGVKRIVGNGAEPTPLDDSVVDFFRAQTRERGFIRPSPKLKIGDTVRVRNGALEGLIGIIDGSMDEKGRIKVLMDFLKEGARIEIPFSYLERY